MNTNSSEQKATKNFPETQRLFYKSFLACLTPNHAAQRQNTNGSIMDALAGA